MRGCFTLGRGFCCSTNTNTNTIFIIVVAARSAVASPNMSTIGNRTVVLCTSQTGVPHGTPVFPVFVAAAPRPLLAGRLVRTARRRLVRCPATPVGGRLLQHYGDPRLGGVDSLDGAFGERFVGREPGEFGSQFGLGCLHCVYGVQRQGVENMHNN
jgi:hypothetical protein